MVKKIQLNCKIYVKIFSGATVSCMEDYMKTSLRNPPDHFILHVGANDLSSEKCSMEIAKSIINLECSLKNEIHGVSVSTIILRTDDKKLKEKRMELNLHLKASKEISISLIDNSRKIKVQHLNKGKFDLTKYGSRILSNNFVNVNKLSKVLPNANVKECNFKDDLTAKKYDECNITLKTIRSDNANKLIFAHLNINSIRNKFEFLATQVKGKIDVLMISETKIDESFPKGNFLIEGFSTPYRLDRDSKGGGIMLYVRADIPSNLLAFEDKPIESLFIELNLQNTKILINCSYNPHKSMVFHLRHHTHISKINLNIFGASISKWSFNFKIELLF